jgi:NAD(P)-dependent dehydrogenase (short-subunit alcohol dehydrogenase family)
MKTVFITGAAHGIGLATAKHFASQGYFVGLYDINEQGLAQVMASGDFPQACSGVCDVTSRQSIEAALSDFAGHTNNQLHILVNNAGVLSAGPFADIAPAAQDLMIDINVKGLTHVAQAGFPYLQKTAGSCLVNLCSVSSIHGIPSLAVYSSSKFYVNGLTQALHLEWAQHDIRVTCVKPDLVNTPMAHAVLAGAESKREIDLQPEDIAVAIDRAVHGKRISYFVGGAARGWGLIDRLLPESLRAWFTRKMLNQEGN